MKLFQLGLIALSGAILLSSCAKDYDGDINDLKKQAAQNASDIETLKASMNAGKLIKTVVPNTAGFLVTFSDNSTISLSNGATGATGATGFVPVLGIDAGGYWTVKTSETGAATQIKDGSGNPLKVTGAPGTNGTNGTNGVDGKAPYIDPATKTWFTWDVASGMYIDTEVKAEGNTTVTTEVIDAQLWVNGVNTGIACPGILHNTVNNLYTFTVPKVGGGTETFQIMQMSEALVMLTAISSPIEWYYNEPYFGEVVSGGTFWDGLTYTTEQLLRTSNVIKLPLMVSPSNANLDLYDFELVYAKGTALVALPIQKANITVSAGYDAGENGEFTRATSATGVWTVAFSTSDEEFRILTDLSGKKVAIKATLKDQSVAQRSLTTKYEYEFYTQHEDGVGALSPTYATSSDIGSTLDVLGMLSPSTPFYKSKITFDPATSTAIQNAITLTDGTIKSKSDDASIPALNTKVVKFKVQTIDFDGVEGETELTVTFALMYVSQPPVHLAEKSHVINIDDVLTPVDETKSTVLVADLMKVNSNMGVAKYTEWVKNTSGLTASIVKKSDHSTVLPGATVDMLDVDGVATTSPLALKSVVITVDPTVAFATSDYQIEMVYTHAADALKNFTVYVPLKLTNPVLNMSTLFVEDPAYFTNHAVSVYGTNFAAATTGADLSAILADDYLTEPASNLFGFEFDGQKNLFGNPPVPRATPLTSNKDITVGASTMGITYNIDLYYYHFGNPANKQLVQTIKVTPRSAIADGDVVEATNNPTMTNIGGAKNISLFYKVLDVNLNDLLAFDAGKKARAATVLVESDNPGMILVTSIANNDWSLTPNPNNTVMVADATVNLTVTVTDVYGLQLIKVVPMTVTK